MPSIRIESVERPGGDILIRGITVAPACRG